MNSRVLVHTGRRAAELALAGMVIFACTMPTTQYSPDLQQEEPRRRIHITDRYGERFDITHAVERTACTGPASSSASAGTRYGR